MAIRMWKHFRFFSLHFYDDAWKLISIDKSIITFNTEAKQIFIIFHYDLVSFRFK